MNKVAKGKRIERMCVKALKSQGFKVHTVTRVRFRNTDIFYLFDILALHPEGKHLIMIQVRSNRVDRKTREAIKTLAVPANIRKEIWCWRDRMGWLKETL